MNVFHVPSLQYNKHMLSFYGLWPYQTTLRKRLSNVIFALWTVSVIVPLTGGLTNDSSRDIVISYETVVATVMVFGGYAQSTMFHVRQEKLRMLFEQINADWRELTDAKEIAILRNFSRQGNTMIFLFTVSTVGFFLFFLALSYLPLFIDENVSRDHSKIFPYYGNRWIICGEIRNIQVLVHSSIGILTGGSIYIVVIAIYICSVQHFCGIYEIVCYRLKKLVTTNKGEISLGKLRNDKDVIPELLRIITKHKDAIKGVRMIIGIFSRTFFIIEICLLICLALLIFDVKYNLQNTRLTIRTMFTALIFIVQAFYMNYGGELVLHFSSKIHSSTFFMQWYLTSIQARKMLLMIIQRSSKSDTLKIGIRQLSLKHFTSIIKASWALATVLLTAHNKVK